MRTAEDNTPRSWPRHTIPCSVAALRVQERDRLILGTGAFVALTAVAALLLVVLPGNLAIGIGAVVVLPGLLVWLWQCPVRGVYVLFAAAVLLEQYYSADVYPDDIGRYVPFFQDVSTWTHIKGLSFSLAELFMLLVLLIWLLKGIAERRLRFERGSLLLPLGLYELMVLVSEIHGLGTGGNSTLSLWEVRGQAYMLVAYVLACNLVQTRRQVDVLAWILVVGSGLKGVQGVWRYLVTLHGNIHSVEAIFPHEQSFFFNAFLTFTGILFLYGGSRRLKRVAVLLLPFVILASLANQRRAAVVALGVGLFGLLFVTVVAHPARRRTVVKVLLVLAVVFPPYYMTYKNSTGLLGEPAHAIASAFTPDPRDASSNLYRDNENKDILATMKSTTTSTLIGYGFGKPMATPYPLADITAFDPFWNIMPHNSILWVWMRLGTVGYLLLWLMIGTAIVQAARLARRLQTPYFKGLATLIVLLVMQEIIFGYLDLQWTNYRNLITVGVLFGLLSWLATRAKQETRCHSGN